MIQLSLSTYADGTRGHGCQGTTSLTTGKLSWIGSSFHHFSVLFCSRVLTATTAPMSTDASAAGLSIARSLSCRLGCRSRLVRKGWLKSFALGRWRNNYGLSFVARLLTRNDVSAWLGSYGRASLTILRGVSYGPSSPPVELDKFASRLI
ncbi:hypothetical protein BD310DRAFT_925876 [Dichomitus squalens]|uniref:Uncharacterized protein n=1 Tax=Dichomitus squalens TaxID=114155 RepID=A0A4Q9PWD8_9APHY|nr:hypothetical protein BD310DRAFT_925876 [Dichomitus squalens]